MSESNENSGSLDPNYPHKMVLQDDATPGEIVDILNSLGMVCNDITYESLPERSRRHVQRDSNFLESFAGLELENNHVVNSEDDDGSA